MERDGGTRFELDRLVSYDDESLLAELRRVAELVPGPVFRRADFDRLSPAHSDTFVKRFDGWKQALTRIGQGERYAGVEITEKVRSHRRRSSTREELVADLQRIAKLTGRNTVTQADYRLHSDVYGENVVVKRFGSWRAALEAAGLVPSRHSARWTNDDMFDNLLEVWTHYGKQPTRQSMNMPPSRITSSAYASRFGSWMKALAAFVERVNGDIERTKRESAPPPVAPSPPHQPRQEDQRSIPLGLRYKVLRRDRFRCVTCGRSPATDLNCHLHVDHIIAFCRGGKTREDNLQTLCSDCNLGKGSGD